MRNNLQWRKPSSSAIDATCIEVARDGDEYLIRDGNNPDGPVLRFTAPEWDAFVEGVKAGEFRAL